MMVTALNYDIRGNIVGSRSGKESSVLHDVQGTDYIVTSEPWDYETSYVKDGELRSRPAREDAAYVWDNEAEEWHLDLDQYKLGAWRTVKALRNQKEAAGFKFNGVIYDSDSISQQRIQGAAQLAQLDSTMSIDWTTQDNSVVTLTASEVLALGVTMGQHINALHAASRVTRSEIYAAQTKRQIDQIVQEWF